MSYTKAEVKSGLFILFSIAALLVMTFVIGGLRGGEKTIWKFRFSYVGGLEKGSPVYFAGNEVGKVKSLSVENGEDRPIVVTAEIPSSIILRQDSRGYIDTLGMMGEKLLEISPGSKSNPKMEPGNILDGVDAIPMHEMITKLNALSDEMMKMTDSLDPMIVTLNDLLQKNSKTIQELLTHLNGTTKGLDTILNGNQEEISKIIANLNQTSANVRDMTEDLKHHPWRLVRKG